MSGSWHRGQVVYSVACGGEVGDEGPTSVVVVWVCVDFTGGWWERFGWEGELLVWVEEADLGGAFGGMVTEDVRHLVKVGFLGKAQVGSVFLSFGFCRGRSGEEEGEVEVDVVLRSGLGQGRLAWVDDDEVKQEVV